MRTDDEIAEQVEALDAKGTDWVGVERADLIACLPLHSAAKLTDAAIDAETWTQATREPGAVRETMYAYMDFAWDKANNERALSAGRSLSHMSAWLWLIDRPAAAEQIRDYDAYGKARLRAICEAFGWDWTAWDNGHWSNEGSADGQPPQRVEPLAQG